LYKREKSSLSLIILSLIRTKNIRFYPIPIEQAVALAEVEVFEHLNGKISIVYKQRKLKFKKIKTIKKTKRKLTRRISIKRLNFYFAKY